MLNTPKSFTLVIENIAKEKKITHMEAVLWYCDQEGIEPDTVGYLFFFCYIFYSNGKTFWSI